MSDLVEALLVAAAREFVWTRPALTFWGMSVFMAACKVAFADKEQGR